jgi:hypothetical protein
LYVANWNFAAQTTTYSDTAVTDSLTIHYWSLSIEEQFYFIWPILLVGVGALARTLRRSVREVSTAAALVVVGASFTASVVLTSSQGSSAYFFTHTRLWAMGIGALLAIYLPRLPTLRPALATSASSAALAGIVSSAVLFDDLTPYPGAAAAAPILCTAVLIVAHQHNTSIISTILSVRPLVKIGHWSYAWYLWHWPAIGLVLLADERWDIGGNDPLLIGAAVVGSLALAAASHRLVENPIRHSAVLTAQPIKAFVMGVVLMVIPLAAGSMLVQQSNQETVATAGQPGLVLSPADARADKPVAPSRCHLGYSHDQFSDNCVWGDPEGEFTVILTGDSHALSWFPAFRLLAEDRGWQLHLWGKDACQPIDIRLWNGSTDQPYETCDTWRTALLQHLSTLEDVDLIVVGRSMGYSRSILGDNSLPIEDRALASEAWGEAARSSFQNLAEMADRVVVLRDVPWFGAPNFVECVSLNLSDFDRCARPLSGNAYRDNWMIEAESASGAAEYIEYVDVTPIVCPADPCPAASPEGIITYRDKHHLTQTYSQALAPNIALIIALIIEAIDASAAAG